jgi:CheY-like chemotaxis protein
MKNLVILCVDDEKHILDSLKKQLKLHIGNAYNIEIAESGEEALELVQEFRENSIELPVVLADHIMPGMKGDELLIEIHRQFPRTLTIMLTGQANADAVGSAINSANLYRYIAKPLVPERSHV